MLQFGCIKAEKSKNLIFQRITPFLAINKLRRSGRRNKRCIIRSKLKFTAHSLRCFSFSQKPLLFGNPVFLYAFGFSLSALHAFSGAQTGFEKTRRPQKGFYKASKMHPQQNRCVSRLMQKNFTSFNFSKIHIFLLQTNFTSRASKQALCHSQ